MTLSLVKNGMAYCVPHHTVAERSRTDSSLQGICVDGEMAGAEVLHLPELSFLGRINGAVRVRR